MPTPSALPTLFPTLVMLLAALRSQPATEVRQKLNSGAGDYEVRVHAAAIVPLVRASYTSAQLATLEDALRPVTVLRGDSRGLVKAADRTTDDGADPTHYDAVWVRDSLWAYLAMDASLDPVARDTAHRLLVTLSDYLASPEQRKRMEAVIAHPAIVKAPDGAMRVLHIRFDGKSPTFADVSENGHPQTWNHKQNDALGLFLDLYCRAILKGTVSDKEAGSVPAKVLARFPVYFEAIHFDEMEDAGSWEEIERLNTSSVALVTSGLERLAELLQSPAPGARTVTRRVLAAWGYGRQATFSAERLHRLIDAGYARVSRQLSEGGESPDYDALLRPASGKVAGAVSTKESGKVAGAVSIKESGNPRYRRADAALLNVIYPARLSRLTRTQFDQVLEIVRPLVGEVGVKRYLGDSYQSGNFWFATASNTDDTSSSQGFSDRSQRFLKDSEAQWFFDSWLSVANGLLYSRYADSKYLARQTEYFNRSLGQITAGTLDAPVLGADGRKVPPLALPESYNTIEDPANHQRFFVPSPIIPLNWAKASLQLALKQMRSTH